MIGLSDKTAPNLEVLNETYNISGTNLTFESWKLALLINGSVMISSGDNILLTTAWIKTKGLNEKADFFPLVVDFQEKFYASGTIGWNRFSKREARPSDEATLASRMIDRPIRPMFPKWIINDTQIIASVLSSDAITDLGFWGIIGASLSLQMSWSPFEGPVSACKIALQEDDSYIFCPTKQQENSSKLVLITAWTTDAITMVEASAKEVNDEEMVKALEYSHNIIKEICEAQNTYIALYRERYGIKNIEPTFNKADETLYSEVSKFLTLEKLECLYNKWKHEFQEELDNLDIEVKELLIEKKLVEEDSSFDFVWALVYKRVKEIMRENILKYEKRLDGRKINEVRQISSEVSLLPRTHWSALFQRGMTQALSITTLWWPDDEQLSNGMMEESTKRYIHHYNFPPYSVWEVRMMRWVWRREIGHGALAERALLPVIPSEAEFPYVMRVVSEIITCNGSSSMASVCGSTLSLMNAWVPIKAPVWGVAIWMIYDEITGEYKILSDIQAQEDFLWDMDLKVTRTPTGITALQMDMKIKWLSMKIFSEAFAQSETAVTHILEEMLKSQPEVATELSKYAPLILTVKIPVDKISTVIGKGWENVQRLEKEYELKISIAEDGLATITAKTQENWEKVIAEIKQILWVPEEGYKDTWIVKKIIEWTWAIVEFKGKTWMIHISKLSPLRAINVEDYVKEWEEVEFEIIQVDIAKWRIGLARIPKEEELKKYEEEKKKKDEELDKRKAEKEKASVEKKEDKKIN
jgi:polyribonucleotide nucleotidyltransferase